MNVRVLKFHIQIPYEKIVDPYFCLCSSCVPFWSYAPFKTKFENLVCKFSTLRLGLRRRSPDYIFEDFPSNFDKITPF